GEARHDLRDPGRRSGASGGPGSGLPRPLDDDRPRGSGMTAPALRSIAVGDEVTPLQRRVTQAEIDAYAEASGDHNPIHVDADFARAVGLPGTIAHGLLELGILAEGSWRTSSPRRRCARSPTTTTSMKRLPGRSCARRMPWGSVPPPASRRTTEAAAQTCSRS